METHGETGKPKPKVYYDGECKVCSAAAEAYVPEESFEKQAVSREKLPPGVTYEEVMQYMYVIDADGTVHKGADGVLRIMDDHWLWKWISPIGRLPVFNALAHALYRVVATHRYLLGGKKTREPER